MDTDNFKGEYIFEQLINRMGRAYYSYVIWKTIRKLISIPEVGFEQATNNSFTMNKYNGIFSGFLYSTENTFIIDLYKFFDTNPQAIKIDTLLKLLENKESKKEVTNLIDSVGLEFEKIKTIRHKHSAHEQEIKPLNNENGKIYTEEIEKIFDTISKILNIFSKEFGNDTKYVWTTEDTEKGFEKLVNDLSKVG